MVQSSIQKIAYLMTLNDGDLFELESPEGYVSTVKFHVYNDGLLYFNNVDHQLANGTGASYNYSVEQIQVGPPGTIFTS